MPEDEEELDDVMQAVITEDFDIGFAIKEKLVSRAVLFYTGEALDGDSDDEDDEEEEEDGDDEDDEVLVTITLAQGSTHIYNKVLEKESHRN